MIVEISIEKVDTSYKLPKEPRREFKALFKDKGRNKANEVM